MKTKDQHWISPRIQEIIDLVNRQDIPEQSIPYGGLTYDACVSYDMELQGYKLSNSFDMWEAILAGDINYLPSTKGTIAYDIADEVRFLPCKAPRRFGPLTSQQKGQRP